MTTGTAPPVSGAQQPPRATGVTPVPPEPSEYEIFVDKRLRQTRRQVKSVDVWTGLITLAAGILAYLLVATLVDHWVVSGGLGFWGRLILFILLVAATSVYLATRVVPPLIQRVNPIFAAYSIEQSRPSLKNSLINFLYLRRQRSATEEDALAAGIYQALERKAAADLEQIPADVAVDRSNVIRLGYVLAAILAVCSLYLALSPKSPLMSFRRIIWPWADLKAPTRVTIEDVQPGSGIVYQGDVVTVSAEVDGLDGDEPVMLYYTTADGQSVDQAIPMTLAEGSSRHQCDLPPGRFGLQQDVGYYLTSGDCRTPRFEIQVQTALSILVDSVKYEYPKYTGIPDRVDQRVADLKAIEGTRVTIRATANQDIGRAAIELDCDPRQALKMAIDGPRTASARLTLMMDRSDPTRPQYESYRLRFTDTSRRENQRPIRHRIEVTRDLPPEIRFVDPPAEQIELPEDAVLELRVRAEDPDFALRRVAVQAERNERPLSIAPLLDRPRPEPPHEGPFQKTFRFKPAELGLEAGDKVIYWAEAEDNMCWEDDQQNALGVSNEVRTARVWPNRTETPRRWITIIPPQGRWSPEQRPDQPERSPDPARNREAEQSQDEVAEQPEKGQSDRGAEPEQPRQEGNREDQQPGQAEKREQGQPDQLPDGQTQPGEKNGGLQAGEGSASPQLQEAGERSGDQRAAQQPSDQEQGDQRGKTSQPGASGEKSPSAEPSQSPDGQMGPQPGTQPSPRREPIDGQTNPGDAFEEILQHLDRQKQNQDASGQRSDKQDQPGQTLPGEQGPGQRQDGTPGQASQQQPDADSAPRAQEPQPATESQPQQQTDPHDATQPNQGMQGSQPSAEGQPSGEQQQPGGKQPSQADQPQPPKAGTGSSDSTQADQQRMPDNEPTGSQTHGSRPQPEAGQGAQAKGPGEPTPEESSGPTRENPDARGGDPQDSKGQGGAGRPSDEDAGSPSPQAANQQRKKQLGEGDQSEPSAGDSPQSPTTSPKDSDSQGDTSGDRSGGGEQGGGQKSKQSGTGTAGTHTAAEQGGSQSDQQGKGDLGSNAGNQVKADRPTGQPSDQGKGPGSTQRTQSGGDRPGQLPNDQPGDPAASQSDSKQPAGMRPDGQGPGQPSQAPSGHAATGGKSAAPQIDPPPSGPGTYRREDPNLEYARKQTNLALEYLKNQLAKDEPDRNLLGRLGWNKEDLRRFYEQWDRMRREAERSGPRAEAARRELDKALDSLGLRARGTEFSGGRTEVDRRGNLREGLRIEPPSEWAEAYRAYQMGVAGADE